MVGAPPLTGLGEGGLKSEGTSIFSLHCSLCPPQAPTLQCDGKDAVAPPSSLWIGRWVPGGVAVAVARIDDDAVLCFV